MCIFAQTKTHQIMKNSILLFLFSFAFCLNSIAGNDPKDEAKYSVYTVKELKEIYGTESMKFLSSMELTDSDQVLITSSPCGGEMPCGGAFAKAKQEAQKLANQCCCVQFFGVICCDPQYGALLAIDAIAMPTNCN